MSRRYSPEDVVVEFFENQPLATAKFILRFCQRRVKARELAEDPGAPKKRGRPAKKPTEETAAAQSSA